MMKAVSLRQVDDDYRTHAQAFLNVCAKATKGKKGTPVYKRFKDFFDYEGAINRVMNGGKRRDIMREVSALIKRKEEKDG